MEDKVLAAIVKLDGWICSNGWKGYDPYDVWAHPAIDMLRSLAIRVNFSAIKNTTGNTSSARRDSLVAGMQKLLMIKKKYNAKAMGLFASGYINLYSSAKDNRYLLRAKECIDWLEHNRNSKYIGHSWGYPFPWRSAIQYPEGTPSAVISSICGKAFWDFYTLTGDTKYLDICENICVFLSKGLNVQTISSDQICFSYTPLDRFHVHNANLFAAEFMIRIGREMKRDDFLSLGTKALNYSVAAQNEDGSFYYWGEEDSGRYGISDAVIQLIDHFHTGFILRSLFSIYQQTDDSKVLAALTKGYTYYRDNLFEDMAIPKYFPHSTYPVDIHSCAEAILCMSTLNQQYPDAIIYAKNAASWTITNMQDMDGHFYYRYREGGAHKTPYIRWGQSWMLLALATFLRNG